MITLGIDTSNLPLGIALLSEGKVLAEWTSNGEKNHSIRLMPAIAQVFKETGVPPEKTDLVAVAQGPGSYTGVRIGVATAKALAWAWGKPLVGISSLKALAHQVPFFPGLIVPFFDARRGRLYTAAYRWSQGALVEVIPENIFHIEELVERLKEDEEAVLFLSEDAEKGRDFLEKALKAKAFFLPGEYSLPRASHIARLGEIRYLDGEKEDLLFTPNYLQRTEAEVRLQEKMGE
ncbi:MAG: tRNA (adenosine(37)-N6)-threonylcarbamoyltransferase complex dimerization subunit type 1 TsaB [Thermicanus sp.]|nr:tRNA (adenosine(37)-N6)-threonylcarbamoyltransferase complex dimerization subunit type 1 TsaB [Thermicanus sp.]